jgi:tetratricopeptide (TPR) repeat protein
MTGSSNEAAHPHGHVFTPGVRLGLAVLAVVLAFALGSARSPLALSLVDAAAPRIGAERAVERYDRIASVGWTRSLREDARWRAGVLLAYDVGDAEAARERFRRITLDPKSPRRGEAFEQVGRLLLDAEHRPAEAAAAFRDAWRAAPNHPAAVARLEAAARAFAEAGDLDASERAWTTLDRRYEGHHVKVALARASIELRRDDAAAALALYREAAELGDEDEASVARLGAAACLERLGNLDGALAELDAAFVPDEVRDARSVGLRARLDPDD